MLTSCSTCSYSQVFHEILAVYAINAGSNPGPMVWQCKALTTEQPIFILRYRTGKSEQVGVGAHKI